jgi:PIN domain nuclease of toxin-antitoxin system
MSAVVADTHAAVWYLTASSRLSAVALNALDMASQLGAPIYIASITLVELQYLVEKGKIAQTALDRVNLALDDPGPTLLVAPLDRAICAAVSQIPRAEVPDLPDRIIAATARALGLPLVSRDSKIRASSVQTVW